jgi:hypothetical protein
LGAEFDRSRQPCDVARNNAGRAQCFCPLVFSAAEVLGLLLEPVGGVSGETDVRRMVDGVKLAPGQVTSGDRSIGRGEADDRRTGEVVEPLDRSDVVQVQRADASADDQPTARGDGAIEVGPQIPRVYVPGCPSRQLGVPSALQVGVDLRRRRLRDDDGSSSCSG